MTTVLTSVTGTILGGASIAMCAIGIVAAVDMITDNPHSLLNWLCGSAVVCLSTLFMPVAIICFVYAAGGTI